MVVVGTLVLPHGAMVFDGDENSTSASCRERHKKLTAHMKESCSQVRTLVKFHCDFWILEAVEGLAAWYKKI